MRESMLVIVETWTDGTVTRSICPTVEAEEMCALDARIHLADGDITDWRVDMATDLDMVGV